MNHDVPAYGLWSLVLVNSAVFLIFAFSFTHPRTSRDWRSFGAFSAFIVALFAEMYGFPLTLYLLAGWLGKQYPQLDPLSHDAGHIWPWLLGLKGNPHFNAVHILSELFILGGFVLLSAAWKVLYSAQREGKLATEGPYARIRHPQYVGFVIIMLGFLLQWPTILTVLMFPVLVVMYARLAKTEEAEIAARFGRAWTNYAAITPAFIPNRAQSGARGPSMLRQH
jgi:protein-S-isoprenylcysteine O-methyltransferase Ste14